MKTNRFFQLIPLLLSLVACSPSEETFRDIYQLTIEKDFFQADVLLMESREKLSKQHQAILQAKIDNAFNKNENSQKNINYILENHSSLEASILVDLYKTKIDNEFKRYQYKSAKESLEKLLKNFKAYFTEEEITDLKNQLKIYSALKNIPPQKIDKSKNLSIMMSKDVAGLNNLQVSTALDTSNFIFDTGANLSVISKTNSQKLGVTILPNSDIEVDALTGNTVLAQLGWVKELKIEHIILENVIFLVFQDKDLAFPSINFQINGILGYPVIAALGEVHLGKNGSFKVPEITPTNGRYRNLALDELTPIVKIDNMLYTFDTGASATMLYPEYFQKNKDFIEENYEEKTIQLGGAGGSKSFQAYTIEHTINEFDKPVEINVSLLKDKEQNHKRIMGNLGQDYLGQFEEIILNFKAMYIKLE